MFVPLLILYRAGHLPGGWGLAVCAAVLLSSGYGFGSLDAKTNDYFFTGFPSYWNIVALYIHAARTPPTFNALLLLVLVAHAFGEGSGYLLGIGSANERYAPFEFYRRDQLNDADRAIIDVID